MAKTEELDVEQFAGEHYFINDEEQLHVDVFPEPTSLSPRFFYRFLPVPDKLRLDPEHVYVKRTDEYGLNGDDSARYEVFIASWNNTQITVPFRNNLRKFGKRQKSFFAPD